MCKEYLFGDFLCDVWNSCLEFMLGISLFVWNYHKSLCLSCVGKILLEVLLVGIR